MSFNFAPITSPPFQAPRSFSSQTAQTNSPSSFQSPSVSAAGMHNSNNNMNINSDSYGHRNNDISSNSNRFSTESVSLSCLSPDAKSMHSLLGDGTILTRFLPLHGSSSSDNKQHEREQDTSTSSSSAGKCKSITTSLPGHIIRSLNIDPPLEIICVDNDTPSKITRTNDNVNDTSEMHDAEFKALPLLCIYTQSSAFVLQIQYEIHGHNSSSTNSLRNSDEPTKGIIQNVHEPFEAQLTATSSQIRRIRPAPHSYLYNGNTFQIMCNRGAMVMLSYDADVVLFHGYKSDRDGHGHGHGHQEFGARNTNININSQLQAQYMQKQEQMQLEPCSDNVTVPARVHSEQTDMTPLVDFCFLPSSPSTQHSIWNAMTILLSSQNGSLYALSPIVFHGTIFPTKQIEEGMEFLEGILDKYEYSANRGAECRRAKAAMQFFKDAFAGSGSGSSGGSRISGNKSAYAKANIIRHARNASATMWPVVVQPIYTAHGEDYNSVECMELLSPPSASSSIVNSGMCALALARGSSLEYMLIPAGENVIPRYAFEPGEDAEYLDGLVGDSAMVVEEVVFGQDDDGVDRASIVANSFDGGRRVVLIQDPVDKTMMHRVSNEGVVSVTTNVVSVLEGRLNGIMSGKSQGQDTIKIKTNAWSSISIVKGSEQQLNGIIVSGDAQFGHVLVAVLTDGTTEAMNVTAALYLNEATTQLEMENNETLMVVSDRVKESDDALKAMLSIPPLHEQIKPQFEKISAGLSSMSKIVGGSTTPREITPGTLATFLSTKQSSEQNIILPLKELNSLVKARQTYLHSMRDHQIEQIEQVKEMVKTLKDRMIATVEKKAILESNTKLLSERSAAILSTARVLAPSITAAEHQYFKDIKRYEANCDKYETNVEVMRSECNNLREGSRLGVVDIRLSEDQVKLCHNLLDGQKELLQHVKSDVQVMEQKAQTLVVAFGLEDERKPLIAIKDCNNCN